MKFSRSFAAFLAAYLAATSVASAVDYKDQGNAGTINETGHWVNNSGVAVPVSNSNPLPVAGSFSAALGGFTPSSSYATPLAVTSTSARVALPTGTVAVVYNTGSNPAYTQLGGSGVVATTSGDVIPAGGWMAFTVGANTFLAAVTSTGSTSLNISGGSGLPTGSGGGAGGGGGGSTPTGSAGTPNANVVTVQGIAGAIGIPVTGSFFQATQPVSIATLPSLSAGASVIGGVTQSGAWNVGQTGGPWTINETQLGGATLGAASAWGVAPTGNVAGVNANVLAMPALPAGGNTIGAVTQAGAPWSVSQSGAWTVGQTGGPWTENQTQLAGVTLGSPTAWGVAPTGNTQGVNANVLAMPSIPAGANTIGSVNQAGAPWSVSWSGQTVGVTSLPSLPTGVNTIGAVTQASGPWGVSWTGQTVGVTSLPSLPAGASTIGAVTQASGPWSVSWTGQNVGVSSLPALATGSNTIGTVNLGTLNGAATAANQTNVESAPGTSATTAVTIQGSASGVAIPVTGTLSASVGGFAPGGSYTTPLAVTTTSSRVVLPTGTTVAVYNTGSNPAYVQLGNSTVTATTSNDAVPAGGWLALTVGANTNLAAITSSGSTTLNLSGGAGLLTGSGGGGGGGGSVPTGSAGSPNANVLSVQGVSGGTPEDVRLTAGSSAIGSITNTAFGISGTLPAFAATPTVNSAQSGAWNITNISGTVTLPTGAATSANQPTNAAIGSTTSGQTGGLHLGAVTTGSPSYTTGQSDPLSLTLAGALRVDGSATTQPVSIASLPALATGANTIGSVTQSGGPWSVSWSGQTVAATQSGAWNVGNITGTVSLPTGAATAANQPTAAAQGSTTSGQTGNLHMGAVTTGAPSYSTGQTSPLSLTPAGALRVDGSSTTQPVSVSSLPSLPAGASTIGAVNQAGAPWSVSWAGQTVGVSSLPALPSGANTVGNVNVNGNAGTPTQSSVSVTTSSTTVLAASTATSFIKLCVASTAANGVWVRWDGGTATTSAPAELIAAGQCDSWVKSTGFLPTSQINAIASSATAVSLIYN